MSPWPFKKDGWKFVPALKKQNDRKLLIKIWHNLLRTRLFEKKVQSLVHGGKIKKQWIFSGIGQESAQVTISTLLKNGDYSISPSRGYAHAISRGFPLNYIAAEVLGKKIGPLRGRGPSTSFTALKYGIFQHSNILGADFGTIVGLSLDIVRVKSDRIAVLFFGDGAATRPQLWSALNLSVLWKLPILWVCENNQYSLSTHISQTTVNSFSKTASAYKLAVDSIESNDATEIFGIVGQLIELVRKEREPAFFEYKTYRVGSHDSFFMTDQSYQDKEVIAQWTARDPLKLTEKSLYTNHIIDGETILTTRNKFNDEVESAFCWGENQADLTVEELMHEKI
ncbi:MAG: thiamine pyrophosphate-dependent dehydrogenase E1 component subunit alpha [Candidatus Sungiibacteriota bacterium]